jgi:hypothetical protein
MNDLFKKMQEDFKTNGFLIVKKFLTEDIANLSYEYCKLKTLRQSEKLRLHKENYMKDWDGAFGDGQINNSFSFYGDPYFDGLLKLSMVNFENYTGLNLSPEYTYWRLYEKDDILKEHIDRPSCEISATICLGYDCSNLSNYIWPIFIKNKNNEKIEIILNSGDMLLYRGCEIAHGRDKFLGLNQAQVFLHFKDKNNQYYNINKLYDERESLGLPKFFYN